jgi:hypothetical protein
MGIFGAYSGEVLPYAVILSDRSEAKEVESLP